nr:hypothetical protein [uncultured Fusobacterium sp.]
MKSKKSNQEYDCNQDTIKDINERIKNRNSWAIIEMTPKSWINLI